MTTPHFSAGRNIAMKVPADEYDRTVAFYRDVLKLESLGPNPPGEVESTRFRFGDMTLWIDKIGTISQAEIWLEIETTDIEAASRYLADKDCSRRDEIEPLPESINGFWLANPASIIHLITE